MILALVSAAFAGGLDLSPTVGFAPGAFRPLAETPALGLGAAWAPAERFAIDLRGLLRVDLSDRGRFSSTQPLLPDRVGPDIVTWRSVASASAVFVPIDGTVEERPLQVRLALGTGAILTVDDLRALHLEGEPSALATARQVHPTIELGGAIRAGVGEAWSMELGLRRSAWIETIDSTTLETRRQWFLTLAPVFHRRGHAPPSAADEPGDVL